MKHVDKGNVEHYTDNWSFTYINYLLFSIGIIFIIVGYLLMYTGQVNSFQSLTMSPLLLVIGYCIIIPLSLIYKK